MAAALITLLVPTVVAVLFWILMSDPAGGGHSCEGWHFSDRVNCWRNWLVCHLFRRCE